MVQRGYPVEVDYTHSSHGIQGPVHVAQVAAQHGYVAPAADRPFRYLDLGSGNALTTLVLAASLPHGEFHAVEINADLIAWARELAQSAGLANIQFHELSFAEFRESGLQGFDFAAAHGVYNWLGATERRQLRDILSAQLRAGGVAFVSYNCRPGEIMTAELRRLANEITDGFAGSPSERAVFALEALAQFRDSAAGLFAQHPANARILDAWLNAPVGTVAAHLFSADYHVPSVAEVASEMAEAGLTFVGDGDPAYSRVDLVLPPVFARAYGLGRTAAERASVGDLSDNRGHRADIYIRGEPPYHRFPADLPLLYGRLDPNRPLPDSFDFPGGDWKPDPVARSIASAIGRAPKNIAELQRESGIPPQEVVELIGALLATGDVWPFLYLDASHAPAAARASAERFNRAALEQRIATGRELPLASPVIGSGVQIDNYAALFLLGRSSGPPDQAPRWVADTLRKLQLTPTLDGVPLEDAAALEQALRNRYERFAKTNLPLLERLGAVPSAA